MRLRQLFIALFLPALSACAPMTVVNLFTPTSTYKVTTGISYGDDPRHRLDVYVPYSSNFNDAATFPVVLFFYGGSWNRGERKDFKFVAEALASRGIVAIIADYRLYPQVRYPSFLEDAAGAVAWTRREIARYHGDPSRIFLMGHSAGAYNAAMLALDPRWLATQNLTPAAIKGWIGLAGPYDFFPIQNPDAKPVFFHPDYPPGSLPINHVSKASPPVFLAAAITDDLVNPVQNTQHMADELRAAGVPVTLHLYPKLNHTTLIGAFARPLRWLAPVAEDVAAFVETTR